MLTPIFLVFINYLILGKWVIHKFQISVKFQIKAVLEISVDLLQIKYLKIYFRPILLVK